MTTKEELQERAAELDVEGRSSMNKAELEDAIATAEGVPEVAAPMEDPVGTEVAKREAEEAVEETPAEDVEPLSLEDTTTTLNGERAASGDPLVTHADVRAAR